MEQIDRTLRRRATFVQTDITIKCPADSITVRGMDALIQSRLRPAGLVQESDYCFHFFTGKAIPPLTQLLIDRGF